MNDTPFVEQSSPPRSSVQPPSDADLRGNDYAQDATGSVATDEYVRAVAYRDHLNAIANGQLGLLAMLKGNPDAYRSLQHKTLPLAPSSPPHVDGG